jgi:hypothetical protein
VGRRYCPSRFDRHCHPAKFSVAAGSELWELLAFFVSDVLENGFVEACEQLFELRGCRSDLLQFLQDALALLFLLQPRIDHLIAVVDIPAGHRMGDLLFDRLMHGQESTQPREGLRSRVTCVAFHLLAEAADLLVLAQQQLNGIVMRRRFRVISHHLTPFPCYGLPLPA